MVVKKNRNPKQGQAMIETIAMVPLIITILMFMYQGYILIHRAQIVQKYLKAVAIGSALNRYDVSIPKVEDSPPDSPLSGASGSFYFVYKGGVEYNLDMWTKSLLLVFAKSTQRDKLSETLDLFSGKQSMGICLGGQGVMGIQVNPAVLTQDAETDWTCQ